jgi:hypothetical protein
MKVAVIVLVVAAVALSFAVNSHAAGQIDNYAPRAVGAFVLPAVMLLLGGLFGALPAISPSGFGTERKSRILFVICGALLMAAGPFFPGRSMALLIITTLVTAALITVVYSFAIYRRTDDKEEIS